MTVLINLNANNGLWQFLFVCRGKPYVHITACTGFANLAPLVDTITLCWDIHIIMVRICLLYLYIRQAFLIKELHRQFIHRRHLPRSPQIFLTWQNKKLQATRSQMLNPQKILLNRLGLPQLQQRFQKLTQINDLTHPCFFCHSRLLRIFLFVLVTDFFGMVYNLCLMNPQLPATFFLLGAIYWYEITGVESENPGTHTGCVCVYLEHLQSYNCFS